MPEPTLKPGDFNQNNRGGRGGRGGFRGGGGGGRGGGYRPQLGFTRDSGYRGGHQKDMGAAMRMIKLV